MADKFVLKCGDNLEFHLHLLRGALETYERQFSGNKRICQRFGRQIERIDRKIAELCKRDRSRPSEDIAAANDSDEGTKPERSVFDDVDA